MVQLATDTVEWTDANGNVQEVTRALRAQLLQPYRGQKMSDLQKESLRFFKDVPVLDVGNKTTSAKTKLILKASGKAYGPYAVGFNVSKLHNFIAQCRAISDADKRALFEKVDSQWSRAWIKAHAPAQSVLSTEPVQRLAAVVEEARTDAEREETARQKTLKDWGFQSASRLGRRDGGPHILCRKVFYCVCSTVQQGAPLGICIDDLCAVPGRQEQAPFTADVVWDVVE